ncbi:MAG: hypothetical protein D3910_04980 [Candidatus Electrothrix sp. ATG2]|nr:hypothetical protein [Candidatus Electrothrix sp. ATG2]
MPFPPPPSHELKIFDSLPPTTEETFNAGIPAVDTEQEDCAIILYSPNLQIIASLDNTNSEVTSTYETSVTHGFTFSTTQSLSITEEFGVNIEVVTEKTSITFALSFTEQWNTSTTKSMTFSCPPGKMAFVYQGTLVSRILSLNSETGQYSWKAAAGKALTQVLVTSEKPIGKAPSNQITIGS